MTSTKPTAKRGKKGSHYVFDRYIPTPTEENELKTDKPHQEVTIVEEENKVIRIRSPSLENKHLKSVAEEKVEFQNEKQDRAKTAGTHRSRPKTGKSSKSAKSRRSKKSSESDNDSHLGADTQQGAEERSNTGDDRVSSAGVPRNRLDEILAASDSEGMSEDYPTTEGEEKSDDFSDYSRETSADRTNDFRHPRGVSRERTRELEAYDDKINFVPKFITAAEAKIPGNASDYDTDISLDDTLARLQEGRANIYEGTGQTMYEASCKIEGTVPISFIVKNLQNKCILMRRHYLSPKDAVCLANGLKYNTMTEELDLVDNHLGPVGGAAFAEMVVKNEFVNRLNLADNNLGNQGVFPFWKALSKHDNLQALILRNNDITKSGMHAFCRALKSNNGLQILDISENNLEATSGLFVIDALVSNTCLFDINLSWNRIQGVKLYKQFAKMIKANNTLEVLNLSKNGTGDKLISLSFKQWKKQSGIKMLDIGSNRLTLKGVKKLCTALVKNTTLEVIRLSNNQIGDDGITWLLKKALKSTSLRVLCLENIRVSSEMLRTMAELQKEGTAQFLMVYGTGHDVSSYILSLVSKIESYMKSYNLTSVDLYFQKPSLAIPVASITKVQIDGTTNKIVTESVTSRLFLLNINFSSDQVESLLNYLEATSLVDPRREAKPKEDWEEDEAEARHPLNAWEPKTLIWVDDQLKLMTAEQFSTFVWNLHSYILYLKANVTPTHEQQSNLLDCRLLKLLTLRNMITSIF